MKGSGWPKKDPKRSNHPHLLDFHWWKNYDVLYCTYWITFVSTGALWPQIPSARAQFSVACSFVQDIGMWGVQTVATECPDHFMQLKLILNHPVGENVQKHHFGTLLRPNTTFYRSLGMPKWYENKQKCITSVEVTQIRIWKSCRLLFAFSGHWGVFKGPKRAVLGPNKNPLGPYRKPKGPGSVSKGIISMMFD